jgi:hypothetical protein
MQSSAYNLNLFCPPSFATSDRIHCVYIAVPSSLLNLTGHICTDFWLNFCARRVKVLGLLVTDGGMVPQNRTMQSHVLRP